MKKTIWILGAVSGVLVLAGSLGPLIGTDGTAGGSQANSLAYLMMLLAAIGSIVAMVIVARKNREAKFGQLIKTGILTALVTTAVYFIGSVIFYQWIMPSGFLENLNDAYIQEKALKFTDEAKRTAYIRSAEADKGIYTNPVAYSAIQALFIFMMCLAPVAVCGYVIFRVKGRPKPAK